MFHDKDVAQESDVIPTDLLGDEYFVRLVSQWFSTQSFRHVLSFWAYPRYLLRDGE